MFQILGSHPMRYRRFATLLALTLASCMTVPLGAHELEEVEVTGRRLNLVGEAVSASQGFIGQQEIRLRPLTRTGDVLELVPGMVVTQHSGTGKANQYFLRGFNLDHGTDFSTWVEGMPVNMRSHGHGHGYTDLNFIIPETLGEVEYRKGSHHTVRGDFSSVGSAELRISERLKQRDIQATLGEDNYLRAIAVGSLDTGEGGLSYGLEISRYDGPWVDVEEDVKKLSGLLKYSSPLGSGQASLTFMGYDNEWDSADQIPERAVSAGLIDELGSLDKTLGGQTSRYSLSGSWRTEQWDISVYAIDSDLDLWSNFTYFLENEEAGDQFQQLDHRSIYGGQVQFLAGVEAGNIGAQHRVGADIRYDDIKEVGLYASRARLRQGAVRSDAVEQLSMGLFYENEYQWNHHLRSVVGARYDYFEFEVEDLVGQNVYGLDLSVNGGRQRDSLVSLNASLIYTLDEHWEAYAALGEGFHSNDARGTTIRLDPITGEQVERVDPLVESLGGELGLRAFWADRLNASAALWYLDLDSELLFVGDAGNTEPTRASERHGVEFTAYYYFQDDWSLDLEYAWTDAQYSGRAPEGNHIPGSVEHVLQAGISLNRERGWFGSLRVRYFGERPLTESGDIRSDSTTTVNFRLGYQWQHLALRADILNLLDSDDHDVDYWYASRLPGEPAGGVEDLHYHILEPRAIRLALSWRY